VTDKQLSILIVEDSESDADLIIRELRRGGYEPTFERVETRDDMALALDSKTWDIIVSDHKMPCFSSTDALKVFNEKGLHIPFIIVSGAIGEDVAVEAMLAGAHDYVMKQNLVRLTPAVNRALREARIRKERSEIKRSLEESEARFRGIFEHMSSGAAIYDAVGDGSDFILKQINGVAEEMEQVKREDVIGKRVAEAFPHLAESGLIELFQRVWKTGKPEYQENAFRDGRERESWRETRVYKPDSGQIVALYNDITERKLGTVELEKKNEEIRGMSQQLWQAAKLATMGELAASIAHELNNPLATVSLGVESLHSPGIPDDQERTIQVIGQEIDRMGKLVANLLMFSRRSRREISTVDIRKEIESTLELVYYHFRKYQVTVAKEYSEDLPYIQADRQQLRQLFLNLFTNASDAMRHGGTLTIRANRGQAEHRPDRTGSSADQTEGGSPSILIEISDTGAGIPPELISKVTEPFFTTKSEGKGTGLGLAICKRVVQEHGGLLDIASVVGPGGGTMVSVKLPVAHPFGTVSGLDDRQLHAVSSGATDGAR
jgi:PAS domain S-box-containing protein